MTVVMNLESSKLTNRRKGSIDENIEFISRRQSDDFV